MTSFVFNSNMADADYALALSLQDEFSALENKETTNSGEKRKRPTSIVDDCWETIDPTPDIRELFLQFNDMYFDGKLSCCEVKWAPRMTLYVYMFKFSILEVIMYDFK